MTEEQIDNLTGLAWDAVIAARDGDTQRTEKLLDNLEKQLRAIPRPECPQGIS